MIAACDTFRSGAVEQLKTHCARLGVPLYERGYEKDPAKVAFEAQRAAARASTDVLLVDTAGAACHRERCGGDMLGFRKGLGTFSRSPPRRLCGTERCRARPLSCCLWAQPVSCCCIMFLGFRVYSQP